jgi:hypothetical protein
MAVVRAVNTPLGSDTRRLIVTGALARLLAVAGPAGLAATTWSLVGAWLKVGMPVVAASAVLVLACALRPLRTVGGLDLVAVLASWLTAWLSVYLLAVNGLLVYAFAVDGSEDVCHDLLCPAAPDLLYVGVFGLCAVAALVDGACSLTAMLRTVRRASTARSWTTVLVGSIVGGALMLAAVGILAVPFVG